MRDTMIDTKLVQNVSLNIYLQVLNVAAPLIALPILLNRLSIENYGKVVFVLSISAFFVALGDMGLTNYASSKVRIKNNVERCRFFIHVNLLKAIVSIMLSPLFFLIMVLVGEDLSFKFLLLSYGFVFFSCISPFWYFLGLEKLHAITVFTFIGRVLFLLIIFLFVKDTSDTAIVICAYLVGALLPLFAYSQVEYHNIKLNLGESIIAIKELFLTTLPLLISNIGVSIYTSLNGFVVGSVLSYDAAGLFGAAERVIKGAQQVVSSFAQAFVGRFAMISDPKSRRIYLGIIFGIAAFSAWFAHTFAPFILPFIGINNDSIIRLSIDLSYVIIFGTMSSALCLAYLLPRNDLSFMAYSLMFIGCINLLAVIIITPYFGLAVVPKIIVASELILLFIFFLRINLVTGVSK
jgi:PST family polysaccharide transporter